MSNYDNGLRSNIELIASKNQELLKVTRKLIMA
jgi:hypothetical protein